MEHDVLLRIAELLKERNEIDLQIAEVIDRPMTSGHLGEWVAAQIFDIKLESSASETAIDGRFCSAPLKGRTVNVKWYLQREGLLDMTASEDLDDYLVMTGPVGAAASSRGRTRPWRIDAVYLFDARTLRDDLLARGRLVGTASSVRNRHWTEAEIYPEPTNRRLLLTDEQVEALSLFSAG
ncbi:hypothetical protein GCM10010531_39380 [Blastococcus jejuensis]|uniref:Restriction endonuclease n=1 Tax=Blastococcus jejuensis TaxID=351224 RepID=A0ABP6PKJ5_9ACTN